VSSFFLVFFTLPPSVGLTAFLSTRCRPQLWKKHYDVDGQVTQHLSPFEQNVVSPMFHDAGYKIFKKVSEFALEAGPGLLTGIMVYYWAEAKHKVSVQHCGRCGRWVASVLSRCQIVPPPTASHPIRQEIAYHHRS
jgi:hypothetical protein